MPNDAAIEKLTAEYERVKEKAEAAKAKAKARLDRAKARKAEAGRKHDAKRKIIAGGLLFKLAAEGDQNAATVLDKLRASLTSENARPSDVRAFESWDWPEANGAKNEGEK